eukprot:scaffold212187_cov30-Prasinocladus_malaysianus.AAC.1
MLPVGSGLSSSQGRPDNHASGPPAASTSSGPNHARKYREDFPVPNLILPSSEVMVIQPAEVGELSPYVDGDDSASDNDNAPLIANQHVDADEGRPAGTGERWKLTGKRVSPGGPSHKPGGLPHAGRQSSSSKGQSLLWERGGGGDVTRLSSADEGGETQAVQDSARDHYPLRPSGGSSSLCVRHAASELSRIPSDMSEGSDDGLLPAVGRSDEELRAGGLLLMNRGDSMAVGYASSSTVNQRPRDTLHTRKHIYHSAAQQGMARRATPCQLCCI